MLKCLEQKGFKPFVIMPLRDIPFAAFLTWFIQLAQYLMTQNLLDQKQFAKRPISNLMPKHFAQSQNFDQNGISIIGHFTNEILILECTVLKAYCVDSINK